ncbi:MAG: phosphoribosylanthranilate isomerase [Verrucomicrobiota bacterium]|nr:phosphoribosylanthranilate isomerase [Verrucomicrobiota bacterium]
MYSDLKIKICGLTRDKDVDLALSLGADYFGFIIYPKSPRAITIERAKELTNRVPKGRSVIVDVETSLSDLGRYKKLGFDNFQIHSSLSILVKKLHLWTAVVGLESLWIAPRLKSNDSLPKIVPKYAKTVLLDSYSPHVVGGTGHVGNWQQFSDIQNQNPDIQLILAGGLSPDNAQKAVNVTGAKYIDVNSGVELAPGIKDRKKLNELFQIFK